MEDAIEVKTNKDTMVKKRLNDILLTVSWREIAHYYFGKSSSWLYHKLDGIDGNGGQGGFTEAEKGKLKDALNDLASRIRICAENI
ncbi:MAG: DUF5053 domain-containing protein [Prevotella sp.]|nr:DUF5053 domain-containing protein [Prevotella sp.]